MTHHRAHNFNPGPAVLPEPVLQEIQAELLDYKGTGMSILESSHRGKDYEEVHNAAQALMAELLGLGSDYKVLYLGGGASTQFAMVPMNLLGEGKKADFIITGSWASKAFKEAKLFGDAAAAHDAKNAEGKYNYVPRQDQLKLRPDAQYLHFTSNNTIAGTQYYQFPKAPNGVPLVCDMSSDMLWRPFDPRPFGLIYAGAQKNLGPAGLTIVVIRNDVLERCRDGLTTMLSYKTHAKENSLYNTPPAFAIYVHRKVLDWIKASGGLAGMETRNRQKGDLLYAAIDARPDFYKAPVEKASRSYMNVVWRLPTEELEAAFVAEAKTQRMIGLKGHRSVGGIRASLYNALPFESVQKLVDFMEAFAKKNG